jgi:hypothetical protein
MPKGKPKGLKPYLTMSLNNCKLVATYDDKIYFINDGYYFGIDLKSFIVRNNFMLRVTETINNINTALLNWNNTTLDNNENDLLIKYLKTLK